MFGGFEVGFNVYFLVGYFDVGYGWDEFFGFEEFDVGFEGGILDVDLEFDVVDLDIVLVGLVDFVVYEFGWFVWKGGIFGEWGVVSI